MFDGLDLVLYIFVEYPFKSKEEILLINFDDNLEYNIN